MGELTRGAFLRGALGGLALTGLGAGRAGAATRPLRGGVCYDTGLKYGPGEPLRRPWWNGPLMAEEIGEIRDGLGCPSLTVLGSDHGRLAKTAETAVRRGMRVYLQPRLYDHPPSEILAHLAEAARAAERLHRTGGDRVTLVIGCEYTLFTPGIVPGATFRDRIAYLSTARPEDLPGIYRRLDGFLREAVAVARAHFRGPITYGASAGEPVDWSLFDIVGLDYYERFATPAEYTADLAQYRKWGKPIMVLEFGCCTYPGAPGRGGDGYDIVDYEPVPPRVKEGFVRSERTQAEHLTRTLGILGAQGLLGAHVYCFVAPELPHLPERALDLDIASFSLVKTIREDQDDPASPYRREPKESFLALARHNRC